MSENTGKEEIVQRIPLPWAVSIVCVFSLPFGLFLGKFNFPLWVSFIVWAEYFALGATPSTWKLIIPSLPAGAAGGALWVATGVGISGAVGGKLALFLGLIVGALIWVTILLYIMPRVHAFTAGSLAVFNGLTLFLGVYFTSSMPQLGTMENPYWVIVWAFIWTTLMAYFGWFLGWLNITLTFPRKVRSKVEHIPPEEAV
jgi:hypothetical protein